MATPVAHGLVAVLATPLLRGEHGSRSRWFAFAMFAVIAADLDFLPGILIGDPGRFHHGVSHSLLAALVFGTFVALVARPVPWPRFRLGSAAAALYASHLLLDLLTKDTGAPFGQPLLWPLADNYFALPAPPLSNIVHGGPGRSVLEFCRAVFSMHNLLAVARELILLLPPVAVVWFIMARKRSVSRRVLVRANPVPRHGGSPTSMASVD